MRRRLAVLASHPIQYQAAWFRALAAYPGLDVEVLFGHRATPEDQANAGFGVKFDWDMPLLDGYPHRFLTNVAANPNLDGFSGIDTPEIAGLIAGRKYDAVMLPCGWYFKAAWQTIVACWRTRTPVMVRGDSNLRTRRSRLKRIFKTFAYGTFVPRLDACLYAGKWSEQYFLHYGAKRTRVFFVPHSVDEESFLGQVRERAPGRRAIREKWRLDPTATVFVYAGKLIPRKRPLDFIQAVATAAGEGQNIQGLMVGDGPMRPDCESLVERLNAPVRFAGFLNQSQMVDGYLAADALVLASDANETWGLVANEAMLCGRPCILSDLVGSGPDLIESGITGDLFPCGNIRALADLLVLYSREPARLADMGISARKKVAGYSIAQAVNGVVEAVETVTDCRARRRVD